MIRILAVSAHDVEALIEPPMIAVVARSPNRAANAMNTDSSLERSSGPSPRASLGENEVHVWTVLPDELDDGELLAAYAALMNDEERARERRFRFQQGRHECRVTRALVRTTLSRYAAVAPESWVFAVNKHGCPSIAEGQCELPLRFNLAHTRGLIACAVTLDRDVGVDAEYIDRRSDTVSIADHFFSPSEVADLRALPAERQRERFFHYWTLKESYIKARGMGLAIPLDQFSFHLGHDYETRSGAEGNAGAIRISFDPRLGDNPESWQFRMYVPLERHRLAVGVRCGRDVDATVVVKRTVPLVS